jgi:6-phosphogluconolactonase (cycloisomerase 2 family)
MIHDNGTLSLVQIAPSGGYLPRQFSINKQGNKVAVGHQGNKTVVVWERDVESGKIGNLVGEVQLEGAVVYTMWNE